MVSKDQKSTKKAKIPITLKIPKVLQQLKKVKKRNKSI